VLSGVSWLITPCGERFFSVGINGIDESPGPSSTGNAPAESELSLHDAQLWSERTFEQVTKWGFNTAGSFSSGDLPLPVIPELDLGWKSHFLWHDLFDPAVDEKMSVAALKAVSVYRSEGRRIGYFSDNEVGWWRGELFLFYIVKPATNYTKRRLVDLIRDYYGENWRRFTGDFVVPAGISDFRELLESSGELVRLRPGGNGMGLVRRWTGIIAGRYYKLVHDALRKADPDALIFGDRLPPYYDPDAVRAMAPYVDAIATNYDVDSPDGWIAHYYFDGLRQLTGNKPILVSEWYFCATENRSGNLNNGHLMTVRSQDQRARGAASAARYFARVPSIVGIHWFQYYDEPTGGRLPDGENYDFGLVDTNWRPYEQLVTALGEANRRLSAIHRGSVISNASEGASEREIPEADIDAGEADLAQWPKEQALVRGLKASVPDAVFGDLFLAWSTQGLHLATISLDYYDRQLLAYADDFPLEDAFRIDLGVDAGAGPRKFAVFVVPSKRPTPRNTMLVEVCRRNGAHSCVSVPSAIATDIGSDRMKIKAQIILPWAALGIAGPPRNGKLRLQLGVTSSCRSRWMSLSGEPPAKAIDNPASWKTVRLQYTRGRRRITQLQLNRKNRMAKHTAFFKSLPNDQAVIEREAG
jgi:hypothetical protein